MRQFGTPRLSVHPRPARPRPSRGVAAEALEARQLMAATPELVRDVNATTDMLTPRHVTTVGSVAYFAGRASTTEGPELFRTDGTTAGTTLVCDILPGLDGSAPANLTNVGGTLFFTATDASGTRGLWKSDGTAAGTVPVRNFAPARTAELSGFTAAAGKRYFVANTSEPPSFLVGVPELWQSDGTAAGTVRVLGNPATGGGSFTFPTQLTPFDGALLFTNSDYYSGTARHPRALYRADATGVMPLVDGAADVHAVTVFGGRPHFTVGPRGTGGFGPGDLYRLDGTNTTLVKAIDSGDSIRLTVSGDLLYFLTGAFDSSGHDLWRSDGTEAGTFMVLDADLPSRQGLTPFGTRSVSFSRYTSTSGLEPWASDGTAAGPNSSPKPSPAPRRTPRSRSRRRSLRGSRSARRSTSGRRASWAAVRSTVATARRPARRSSPTSPAPAATCSCQAASAGCC